MTAPAISEADERLCKILRGNFNSLRQRQKQGRENSTLTDDIRFTLQFINSSVNRPVAVLRVLGIIITPTFVAFHLNALQSELCLASKTRALSLLHRDGWKEADESCRRALFPLIGEPEAKNWYLMNFPDDSVAKDFLDTRMIATEANINPTTQDRQNPTTPIQSDVIFPLVSIQYERVYEDMEVVDFKPLAKALEQNRKLEIFRAESFQLRTPS
jgi:hypothetical protein